MSAAVVVAVVSWNTRELLDRCLESMRPAADAGLAQVWVVDNASSDGSVAMVRERHPWVTLVASEQNLGYGPAINLVAARTSSPWLVASNADVRVRPGAFDRLLAAAEADPAAGILAPRLILPDGSTQHSVWPFPTVGAHVRANLGLAREWDPDRSQRVPWAFGAFLLLRREAWDAVGGFAADQWMSAEDVDLGWRVHEAGWATRYVAGAVVDHDESAAVGQRWGDDLTVHWQRCSFSWMERRFGRRRIVAVGLVNLAGALLRLPRYELLARLRPAEWGWRARRQRRWTLVQLYAFAPRRVLERYR